MPPDAVSSGARGVPDFLAPGRQQASPDPNRQQGREGSEPVVEPACPHAALPVQKGLTFKTKEASPPEESPNDRAG